MSSYPTDDTLDLSHNESDFIRYFNLLKKYALTKSFVELQI